MLLQPWKTNINMMRLENKRVSVFLPKYRTISRDFFLKNYSSRLKKIRLELFSLVNLEIYDSSNAAVKKINKAQKVSHTTPTSMLAHFFAGFYINAHTPI